MKERERIVVAGTFAVLLIAWLGFLLHRSPRFPGSALGSAFGIAGAALMLIPLAYPIAKRVSFLRAGIARHVSLPTLMAVHVYAGILGPLFAMIHTGHRFESWLGMTLTSVMLLVVVTGFAARYLLTYVAHEIADKLVLLQTARGDLDSAWAALTRAPAGAGGMQESPLLAAGLASIGVAAPASGPAADVTRLAAAVADLEYAIRTHEILKRWFARSLKVHIGLSVMLYALLALHIGASIHAGLRWLQ